MNNLNFSEMLYPSPCSSLCPSPFLSLLPPLQPLHLEDFAGLASPLVPHVPSGQIPGSTRVAPDTQAQIELPWALFRPRHIGIKGTCTRKNVVVAIPGLPVKIHNIPWHLRMRNWWQTYWQRKHAQ